MGKKKSNRSALGDALIFRSSALLTETRRPKSPHPQAILNARASPISPKGGAAPHQPTNKAIRRLTGTGRSQGSACTAFG